MIALKYSFYLICFASSIFVSPIGARAADGIAQKAEGPEPMVLLASRDFARLEAVVGGWQRDFDSGKLSGDQYLRQLFAVFPEQPSLSWDDHIQEWQKAYPRSYAATYSRGSFQHRYGWVLRGGGYANETTAKQADDMIKYVSRSVASLEQSLQLAAKPFPSYYTLIIISRALQTGREKKFFAAAENLDPTSYETKKEFMVSLAPKWGGSIEMIDGFVESVRKSPLKKGDFSRLVSHGNYLKGEYLLGIERYADAVERFRQSYFDWPDPSNLKNLSWAAAVAKKGGLPDKAIAIYAEVLSADPNNLSARTWRAQLLETEKRDYKGAKAELLVAADAGDAWAQNRLGWWYMTGTGGERNLDLARTYLTKAMERGNKSAKGNLTQLDALAKEKK